jgi:Uma2 family endonuclease
MEWREEVIGGKYVEHPARPVIDRHIAFGSAFWIDTYLQSRPIGRVFQPAPRFQLCADPVTIRIPDVAYVAAHRCAEFASKELWRIAPDLITEVLSHPNRQEEVDSRIDDFFAAGTAIAWIIDTCDQTCIVRHRNGGEEVYGLNNKIFSAPVLPRLCLRVYELFGK